MKCFLSAAAALLAGTAAAADGAAAAQTAAWLDTVRPAGGDQAPALGAGCTQFDWAETQRAQADIAAHQNPADCASPDTRYLVLRTWKTGGLASVAQEVAAALHLAFVTGRVLLFQGEGTQGSETRWNLAGPAECGDRTWDCFFEPLSACRLADVVDTSTQTVVLAPDNYLDEETQAVRVAVAKRPLLNAWNRDVPEAYRFEKPHFWWFAQLSAYAFRPLPHVIAAAADFARGAVLEGRPWEAGVRTLALHVRSGDRYKNHAAVPLADAARRIRANEDGARSVQALFMATDDPSNLQEAEAFVRQNPAGPPVFWDPTEDRRAKVVKDIEARRANATALTIEAAKNVILLAAANRLTGTRHSQFSKLAAAVGCAGGRFEADPDIVHYAQTLPAGQKATPLPRQSFHETSITREPTARSKQRPPPQDPSRQRPPQSRPPNVQAPNRGRRHQGL